MKGLRMVEPISLEKDEVNSGQKANQYVDSEQAVF
jgi:hypothetical protein